MGTEGWLPDLGDIRLASRPGSMNPYSFLARAVTDPYLLRITDQARAGHRLSFRNNSLQPTACLCDAPRAHCGVSFHYHSSTSGREVLNIRKSKRQEKIKLIEGKSLIFWFTEPLQPQPKVAKAVFSTLQPRCKRRREWKKTPQWAEPHWCYMTNPTKKYSIQGSPPWKLVRSACMASCPYSGTGGKDV